MSRMHHDLSAKPGVGALKAMLSVALLASFAAFMLFRIDPAGTAARERDAVRARGLDAKAGVTASP